MSTSDATPNAFLACQQNNSAKDCRAQKKGMAMAKNEDDVPVIIYRG
jgi:hypothetical protein